MKSKPTVFVVDDDAVVRHSLRRLLVSSGLPVETFETAQAFLHAFQPKRPGCLVVDARMSGLSGLDLQDLLQAQHTSLPIIMTGDGDVPTAVRALKGGAFDFIEKPFRKQLILDRIRHAIALNAETRKKHAYRTRIGARIARLTPRERQVMELVVDGKVNKQIGALLGLSPKTTEIHRARVMSKMQVHSLAELARTVQQHLDQPNGRLTRLSRRGRRG